MRRFGRILLILLAVLLLVVLVGPFLVPVRPLTDTRPARALADADSQFVTVPFAGTDGIDLHVKQGGGGSPTFVLLHGFSSNLYTWDRVFDFFAAAGQTVAYDRIPFGLSERLLAGDWQADNPYLPDAARRQLLALLDALAVDRPILVGNSAGGTLALATALENPERVAALILISPAVYTQGGTPPFLSGLFNTPQMARLGPLVARGFTRLDLADQAYYDVGRISAEEAAEAAVFTRVDDWDRAFWEFTAASEQLDLTGRLDQVTVPTLVITGDADGIVPPSETEQLAAALPDATLVVIPQCGHVAHQECDAAFREAVTTWLATVAP